VLPEVPTMAEAGYPMEAAYWFGLVVPAATPPPVVAKLENALGEVLARHDVKQRLTEMGALVQPLDGSRFAAFIRGEMDKWAMVIAKNHIKLD